MTTNSELLDQAMSRLGQRSSTRVRSDVVVEINKAITRFERGTFLPWFLEAEEALVFASGESSQAMSADFLREAEDTRPFYTLEGTVYFLEKRLYGVLMGLGAETSVKYYAIRGETFYIRMEAEQAYSITVPSYRKQNDPIADNASEVSNEWLLSAEDWVVNEALAKVAAFHLHNQKLAADLKGDATGAKNDLYIYHESRVHTNQDYFVGGSSDGS